MSRAIAPFLAVAALAVVGSCLDDLAEPSDCPTPARIEGRVEDCIAAFGDWLGSNEIDFENSCLGDPSYMGCYRGNRDCSCNPNECKASEDACYPPGDCPPAVRERFPSAECVRLSADDVGPELTEPEQCLCGCEECITVCDGKGPVWSQVELYNPYTDDVYDKKGYLWLSIARLMPASGRLGVYVRARGRVFELPEATAGEVYLFAYPQEQLGEGMPAFIEQLPRDMADSFEELVLPEVSDYSWKTNDERPGSIVVSAALNAATMLEIDCIVPFVY